MTKIYPFQKTARWLSLGFLAAALILGSWATAGAQEGQKEPSPRRDDPRMDKVRELKPTHDLSSGEAVVHPEKEEVAPVDLSEHHAMLRVMEGNWSVQARLFLEPGKPPVESRGVARNEMVLGGRALKLDYKGVFMGQPFVGTGFEGYDMDRGEHFSTWLDNTSTGVMVDRGSRCQHHEDERHAVTYHGEVVLPGTTEPVPTRTVIAVKNSTTYTLQQWIAPPDGEEQPAMQIIYTRQETEE